MSFTLRPVERARTLYREYPRDFWVLIGATFIDSVGGAILFPFFTLYVTAKFEVGMTEVGGIFMAFSLASVVGTTLGGALSDRMGRKGILLFGLLASAISSLFMGLVSDFSLFIATAVFVGLFANAGGPARQAMVADILPVAQRAQGYGVLRVVQNLAVTIGPAIGGLLAVRSYLSLFVLDAVSSLITALAVYLLLAETKPTPAADEQPETTLETFAGYGKVLRDGVFMIFMLASVLMVLVYMQMNGTLAVYLRDMHGVSERGFGWILSMNAAMVVLFQFAITRRIEARPPFLILALGMALYAAGFAMYGFVSTYPLFLFAMVVITLGEMLTVPVSQAVVARLAPEDMRGRYMAVSGFSWIMPSAVGLLLAGLIMDNMDPRWVWYAAGLVGTIPVGIYLALHQTTRARVVAAEVAP